MTTPMFSINAAAEVLEKDRRTLVKALRHTKPDGKVRGADRWRLKTILDALAETQPAKPAPRNSDNGGGAANYGLAMMYVRLDDLRGEIEGAETVEERRRLMREEFFPLLAETTAAMKEDSRQSGEDQNYAGFRIEEHLRIQLVTIRHCCGWHSDEVLAEYSAVTCPEDEDA